MLKRIDRQGLLPLSLLALFVFTVNCATRSQLAVTLERVDAIKLVSLDTFQEYYSYQVSKIVSKVESGEFNEVQAWQAKEDLDDQAGKVTKILESIQSLEITLANTLDLYHDSNDPKAQEKINELVSELLNLIGQVTEQIEHMKVEV